MSEKTRIRRVLLMGYYVAVGGLVAWEVLATVARISGVYDPGSDAIILHSGNSWQKTLVRGESVTVALSHRACGIIPEAISCDARYVLTLRRRGTRWCENKLRLVGTELELGGRCGAHVENSVISLLGTPFSFNDQGELFFGKDLVGYLEAPAPPNHGSNH